MTDVARQHLAVDKPGEDQGQSGRPMRADARRNYERLVVAAREVFAQEGGGASMEAIARRAGVGVGTLYRHFPNRIDVVEAVYRTDVDNLVHTAEQVSVDLEPWPALVAFLEAFVRYAQGKRTFLNELHEAFDKSPDLKPDMMDRVRQAMELVVGRAQQAGVIRTDVDGSDLMQLVGPMCTNATLTEDQSTRLLGMILDGLRKET
jgi:AcrR family transcriptional regulator